MIVRVNCVEHHTSREPQDLYALPSNPIKHPCKYITDYAHTLRTMSATSGRDRVKWSISPTTAKFRITAWTTRRSPPTTYFAHSGLC